MHVAWQRTARFFLFTSIRTFSLRNSRHFTIVRDWYALLERFHLRKHVARQITRETVSINKYFYAHLAAFPYLLYVAPLITRLAVSTQVISSRHTIFGTVCRFVTAPPRLTVWQQSIFKTPGYPPRNSLDGRCEKRENTRSKFLRNT